MTDYGARGAKRRRGVPFGLITVLVGVPLIMATALITFLVQRQHAIAEAAAWNITGPPCATLTLAQYKALPYHPVESFTYEGVGFARSYGHVSCNAVVNNGGRGFGTFPECQFTSADVIHITTPTANIYYSTDSHPATVAVHAGQPSCVMAGHFTGQFAPAADTAVSAVGGG